MVETDQIESKDVVMARMIAYATNVNPNDEILAFAVSWSAALVLFVLAIWIARAPTPEVLLKGAFWRAAIYVRKAFFKLPRDKRLMLMATLFWFVLVMLYVWLDEPYGSRVSGSEWHDLLKIFLIPPALAILGWWMFGVAMKDDKVGKQ